MGLFYKCLFQKQSHVFCVTAVHIIVIKEAVFIEATLTRGAEVMSKVKDALCEYGEFDVSIDRDKYIGGSDIPAVLGISKFTTRWQLLLEKAGLAERPFAGNRYTEYGHIIEPQIRDYINLVRQTNFVPNRVINGDIRYHSDGFNGEAVLEVKDRLEKMGSITKETKFYNNTSFKNSILILGRYAGKISKEINIPNFL